MQVFNPQRLLAERGREAKQRPRGGRRADREGRSSVDKPGSLSFLAVKWKAAGFCTL